MTLHHVTGVSHIALNTADLGRFRRFYEGVLGIPHAATMRMDHPPFLRHAFFPAGAGLVLHVFEVPGYDPQAQGIGIDIGERGRIDHFGLLVPDADALHDVARRLRAAGASDGKVGDLGPMLSVHATDPDGLQFEVNCPNLHFDVEAVQHEIEETGADDWLSLLAVPASGGGR